MYHEVFNSTVQFSQTWYVLSLDAACAANPNCFEVRLGRTGYTHMIDSTSLLLTSVGSHDILAIIRLICHVTWFAG